VTDRLRAGKQAAVVLPGGARQAAGDGEQRGRLGPTFRSLRHRDFRLIWFGTLFGGGGQWVQQATLGWLAYQLTGSALVLGVVNGLRSLPMLALGPFAGVAADRFDRKHLMLTTQMGVALVSAAFAVVLLAGQVQVWHLYTVTALSGAAWAFTMPVRHSVIPSLVPRADLMNALALNSAGFSLSRVVGPAIAGFLIAAFGPGENFLLQSLLFLAVGVMVVMARIPEAVRANETSVVANIKEGAAFIWRHRTVRTQLFLALAPVVAGLPYSALLPIYATDILDVGPGGFGLMMGAPGIGAVLGTLTLASVERVERKGRVLLVSAFGFGLFIVLFAVSRSFPLSLAWLFLLGLAQMVYFTTNSAILQLATPEELRGRVMGVYLLNQGLMPFGSLLAGALADLLSAPTAVAIMGAVVMLMAVVFWVGSPGLRRA
jgi:MFS family permease